MEAADLQTQLTETLSAKVMSSAGLDEWELLVEQLGKATRHRSPDSLLPELTANLNEIQQALTQVSDKSLAHRLVYLAARLSGLMSLTLLKCDDKVGSLNWVRTGRLFAAEAADPQLRSWVQAQEAYYHFYDNNLACAIESAQYAQELAAKKPGAGSALAAALEARAYAMLGRKEETLRAIEKAESYLEKLDNADVIPSAFGYSEAQLRFHQANALTHLRETSSALRVQDRALELCAPGDFMDRALVLLDRVECLIVDGDLTTAIALAKQTLSDLQPDQAQGIIVNRARETLRILPASETTRPDVVELYEIIRSISDSKTPVVQRELPEFSKVESAQKYFHGEQAGSGQFDRTVIH